MSFCESCDKVLEEAQFLLIKDTVYKSCPGCSKNTDEHIFYLCPSSFGATTKRVSKNNPIGLQSHCSPCRSGKIGPFEGALSCSDALNAEGYIIEEIRFLPMGKDTFPKYEDAKEFILEKMPARGSTYYYRKSKMDCPKNTLVMFQYDATLIGYAVYTDTVELQDPIVMLDGNSYYGYYQFVPGSIALLDKPITSKEFQKIDATFKGFGQACQNKPVALLPAIFNLVNNGGCVVTTVESTVQLFEEIEDEVAAILKEGSKKQVTVNAYERNPHARVACINHYRKKDAGRVKCQICGFDFGKVYGEDFMEKIHIHHLVEISSLGEEYVVDPVKDLMPICPNCHMIAHSKKPPYSPDEIRQMIDNNK